MPIDYHTKTSLQADDVKISKSELLNRITQSAHAIPERWCFMKSKSEVKTTPNGQPACAYDDGNIPDVDLPNGEDAVKPVEPLPESERPRKDGPGGE